MDNQQTTLAEAIAVIGPTNKLQKLGLLNRNNIPYQHYIDSGFFNLQDHEIELNGSTINYPQVFITSTGMDFIKALLRGAR